MTALIYPKECWSWAEKRLKKSNLPTKLNYTPATFAQTPENLGATIYHGLGLPRETHWQDVNGRPHFIYHGEPIAGLM